MKYIVLPFLVFGCVLSLKSQTSKEIFRLRAFETKIKMDDQPYKEGGWQERNIVVVINFAKMKIQTYGDKPTDIDLIVEKENYKDDSSNMNYIYSGVDPEGEKCTVTLVVFAYPAGSHIATLGIDFYELRQTALFRLKKDE